MQNLTVTETEAELCEESPFPHAKQTPHPGGCQTVLGAGRLYHNGLGDLQVYWGHSPWLELLRGSADSTTTRKQQDCSMQDCYSLAFDLLFRSFILLWLLFFMDQKCCNYETKLQECKSPALRDIMRDFISSVLCCQKCSNPTPSGKVNISPATMQNTVCLFWYFYLQASYTPILVQNWDGKTLHIPTWRFMQKNHKAIGKKFMVKLSLQGVLEKQREKQTDGAAFPLVD